MSNDPTIKWQETIIDAHSFYLQRWQKEEID